MLRSGIIVFLGTVKAWTTSTKMIINCVKLAEKTINKINGNSK